MIFILFLYIFHLFLKIDENILTCSLKPILIFKSCF